MEMEDEIFLTEYRKYHNGSFLAYSQIKEEVSIENESTLLIYINMRIKNHLDTYWILRIKQPVK